MNRIVLLWLAVASSAAAAVNGHPDKGVGGSQPLPDLGVGGSDEGKSPTLRAPRTISELVDLLEGTTSPEGTRSRHLSISDPVAHREVEKFRYDVWRAKEVIKVSRKELNNSFVSDEEEKEEKDVLVDDGDGGIRGYFFEPVVILEGASGGEASPASDAGGFHRQLRSPLDEANGEMQLQKMGRKGMAMGKKNKKSGLIKGIKGSKSSKSSKGSSCTEIEADLETCLTREEDKEDELETCLARKEGVEDELEACLAREVKPKEKDDKDNEIDWLYVQRSLGCSFRREAQDDGTYRYFVDMDRVDPITYGFGDRPSRQAYTMESWSFAAIFDELFVDSKPNGALTYSSFEYVGGEIVGTFEGPMISVYMDATDYQVGNHESFTYRIRQSEDQERVLPLSFLFENESDVSSNYTQCSYFIDPAADVWIEESETTGLVPLFEDIEDKFLIIEKDLEFNPSIKPPSISPSWWDKTKARWDGGNAKYAGTLAKDHLKNFQAALASTKGLIDTVNDSSKTGAAVAKSVGDLMVSAGFLLAPFGPVGAAVVVVGAVVSFVSSFFAQNTVVSKAHTLNYSDVLMAVKNAISDTTTELQISGLQGYTTVFRAASNTASTNLNRINSIKGGTCRSSDPSRCSVNKIADIVDDMATSFETQWAAVVQMMAKMNEGYIEQYSKDKKYGSRGRILEWINGCKFPTAKTDRSCQINWGDDNSHTAVKNFLYDGTENLKNCRTKVTDTQEPWANLQKFGKTYVNTQILIWNYVLTTGNILCHKEGCKCNTEKKQPDTCPERFRRLIDDNRREMYEAIVMRSETIQETFFKPQPGYGNRTTVEYACEPSSYRWPINQKCESSSQCNFKHLFIMPCTDWNNRLGPPKAANRNDNDKDQWGIPGQQRQFENWYKESTCETKSQDRFEALIPQGAFWEILCYGYKSEKPIATNPNLDTSNSYLERGECGKMCEGTNNGRYCITAIANFCPDRSQCKDLFQSDADFADGQYSPEVV